MLLNGQLCSYLHANECFDQLIGMTVVSVTNVVSVISAHSLMVSVVFTLI